MGKLRLHLCKDCLADDETTRVTRLRDALGKELGDDVALSLSPCLDRCEAPVALAMQSTGGAGYIFSGIDLAKDRRDIIETCRAYLESPNGWIEDARPCGRLRFCLAARLPA